MPIQDFQLGVRNSKIIHVNDVESGLKCNCYCPACGGRFVAYKGKILRPHFKHQTETNCKYSFETALHYLAKEIILEKSYLDLPFCNWEIPYVPATWFGKMSANEPMLNEIIHFRTIHFDMVEVEKWEGNFKPDLKCHVGEKQLLIEITVTHGIDQDKLAKIKNNNIPLLEINLSLLQHEINKKTLRRTLFNKQLLYERAKTFRWIYNPKNDKLYAKQKEKSKQIFDYLKENGRYIKLYGKNKEVYSCPISTKAEAPYKYADSCKFCIYNLGKITLPENSDNLSKRSDIAVMCIGHKKHELGILFKESNVKIL